MKKRTLYELTFQNRSRIEKSEKAGCISCHTIFPASEALEAKCFWEKALNDEEHGISFRKEKEDVYCPNPKCGEYNCVVGDADLPDFVSFKRIVENAYSEDVVAIEFADIDIEHPAKYKGKLYIARTRGVGLPNDSYIYVLLTEQEPRTEPAIVNEEGFVISSEFPSDVEGDDVLTSNTIVITNAFECEVKGKEMELTLYPYERFDNHQEIRGVAERLYGVKSADWRPLNPEFPPPIFPDD